MSFRVRNQTFPAIVSNPHGERWSLTCTILDDRMCEIEQMVGHLVLAVSFVVVMSEAEPDHLIVGLTPCRPEAA